MEIIKRVLKFLIVESTDLEGETTKEIRFCPQDILHNTRLWCGDTSLGGGYVAYIQKGDDPATTYWYGESSQFGRCDPKVLEPLIHAQAKQLKSLRIASDTHYYSTHSHVDSVEFDHNPISLNPKRAFDALQND